MILVMIGRITHGNGLAWIPPVPGTLRTMKMQTVFDVYLDLCAGCEKPYYVGLEIVRALEKLELPLIRQNERNLSI